MSSFHPHSHFGFLTNRIGRCYALHMRQFLREQGFDFPPTCLGILGDLAVNNGSTQKELGMSLIKKKSSVNKMLEDLILYGLIEKKDDPKDKRNKRIFLTAKGKQLKKAISRESNRMELRLLSEIPEEEIVVTKKVLSQLYSNLLNEQTHE